MNEQEIVTFWPGRQSVWKLILGRTESDVAPSARLTRPATQTHCPFGAPALCSAVFTAATYT